MGTLNKRCRSIIGTQKGTIILTTTHMLRFTVHNITLCYVLYTNYTILYIMLYYVFMTLHHLLPLNSRALAEGAEGAAASP